MQRVGTRIIHLTWGALALSAALPEHAAAGGTGMPWEAPLQEVLDSVTGPVANAVAIIAVTVFGLTLAFGGGGGALRTAVGILFGISIAFAATSFFTTFFGFGGGALVP